MHNGLLFEKITIEKSSPKCPDFIPVLLLQGPVPPQPAFLLLLIRPSRWSHTVTEAIALGAASLFNVGITNDLCQLCGQTQDLPSKTHASYSDEIIFLGQFNKILALVRFL